MFDTPSKIKNFIKWCQENKIKSFKYKDIEFELSELSFIPEAQQFDEINLSDQKTFSEFDNMTEEEKNELLYWSSGKIKG